MRFEALAPIAGLVFPATVFGVVVERAEETALGRLEQAVVGAPAPTNPPKRSLPELFEREINSDRTCGYFHSWDDPDEDTYPITCALSDSICTVSGRQRGCCDPKHECPTAVFPTTCLDYASCPYLSDVWPTGTMCCESSVYPYCVTNLWSTDPKDVYTFFACHMSSTSRFGIMEAYSNSDSTPTSPTPSTTTTPDPTTTTPPTPTTTTPVPTGGSGGSKTGPIVGGVVGGLAVVGIGLLAVFYFMKKRRNSEPAGDGQAGFNGSPQPPIAPAPQPMVPQQTGMSQPYDPRQSYFNGQSPTGYPLMGPSPTSPYAGSTSPQPGGYGPNSGTMSPQSGGFSPQPPQYASPAPDKQLSSPPQTTEVSEAPATNPRGMSGGNNPVEMSA